MVKDHNPDLMILDIMLPGLNGYDVCKKLEWEWEYYTCYYATVKDKEIDKVWDWSWSR